MARLQTPAWKATTTSCCCRPKSSPNWGDSSRSGHGFRGRRARKMCTSSNKDLHACSHAPAVSPPLTRHLPHEIPPVLQRHTPRAQYRPFHRPQNRGRNSSSAHSTPLLPRAPPPRPWTNRSTISRRLRPPSVRPLRRHCHQQPSTITSPSTPMRAAMTRRERRLRRRRAVSRKTYARLHPISGCRSVLFRKAWASTFPRRRSSSQSQFTIGGAMRRHEK